MRKIPIRMVGREGDAVVMLFHTLFLLFSQPHSRGMILRFALSAGPDIRRLTAHCLPPHTRVLYFYRCTLYFTPSSPRDRPMHDTTTRVYNNCQKPYRYEINVRRHQVRIFTDLFFKCRNNTMYIKTHLRFQEYVVRINIISRWIIKRIFEHSV